jgi:cell division septation protein DedD
MDKQKIFWVVLSVTVLVVVVLVVGVFLLKGSPKTLASASGTTQPATDSTTGLYEFGRDAASAKDDTEVLRFVIGGSGTGTSETAADSAGTSMESGSAPAASAPSETVPAASTATTTAAAATATAVKPPAAKPAAAKPAASAPPKSAAASKGSEYWIQTGSYKSQTRAEDLSQSLAVKGLAGRVFCYSKSGETFFRVRIGPYSNRKEAEKFLAIVRQIQGLEASYISFVAGSTSVN